MIAEKPTTRPKVDRELRAYEDAANYLCLPGGGETDWNVVNLRSGAVYTVDAAAATCSCPDHQYRRTLCRHLRLVAWHIRADREAEPPAREAASTGDADAATRAYAQAQRARWDG